MFIFLNLLSWIRIRMDPHSFHIRDPDPHSEKLLDPDPLKINADPQPWFVATLDQQKDGSCVSAPD